MSTSSSATSPRAGAGSPRTGVLLRVVAALALGCSAWVHARIAAGRPPLMTDGEVTLSGLFVAQAVAATLVVVWVLVSGSRPAWLALLLVAAGSFAALVLSVYVAIPSIGPLPRVHEPVWYADKYLAAGSAAVAVLVAVVALAAARRPRDVT